MYRLRVVLPCRFFVQASRLLRQLRRKDRMCDFAAGLVDRVIPHVPVRQWVLTVPHGLRAKLAFDPALTSVVLRQFIRAVSAWLRRRARRLGVRGALKTAAVTVIQRFNSAVDLSVHYYALFLDGAYRHGTMHGPGYSGADGPTGSFTLPGEAKFSADFHVFAIEWKANVIRWYVDDTLYANKTPADTKGNPWVFDHPFFIILNLAVGGDWPGNPYGTTVFPQKMLIDYVHVCQR
jgi:Glycosyl hydrolases family 16